MIINEDVYFEHFGIKGMKWGVQNKKDTSNADKVKSLEKSSEGKLASKYIEAKSKFNLSKKDQSVELAKNKEKFLDKSNPSGRDISKKV
jgi:hypothetical protein